MDGSLALVLHAHLPFVRHPEFEDFLEEDWFYEALSETYLPLLGVFDRLADEGVQFQLSMTLTPTLLAMLGDALLMQRYARRLDRLCELGEREVHRTRSDAAFHLVARFYLEHFRTLREHFHARHRGDLVTAFRRHADAGRLELLTCCATHGFLPLMKDVPPAVRAQVAVGAMAHARALGRRPRGIWLAECGYFPGLEDVLAGEDLRFFFVEAHGLLFGTPPPRAGVHAPVFTRAAVAAFGRDPESSYQVWSAETGYPGHPDYREFYRDIGWELPLEDVRPWMQPTGERKATGFKYHRITGPGAVKAPYVPELARARAEEHALHFAASRERQLAELHPVLGDAALVVAPYDAELFGHWWFEGPHFLEALLRRLARPDSRVRLTTPPRYLQAFPEHQVSAPAPSSWGREGYSAMWLDPVNDWVYREVNGCAEAMVALAGAFPHPTALERRALNQAARELLLAQSSDWAFILKTGTMVEYATRRVRDHVDAFRALESSLRRGAVDEEALCRREAYACVFPDLDFRVYQPT
ncbi:MAG: DUF1957 domain-containing protein [Myxococcaceae bacterium]|nr:DUF1957 domain-containing protein [Myxococcaceae bacterium]MCI0673084.1 DUF1957 domain-containing protein [Myxococcaceae bacterium]